MSRPLCSDVRELAIDIQFNAAVLTMARRLFPCGFKVAEDAPQSYEELVAGLDAGKPMLVRIEGAVQHFQPLTGLWKPTFETSFYLSGRPVHAKIAARANRNHWGIENKSHYTRDVSLSEDASRIRKNPSIFARLRSFGYNILKRNQSDTIPQDRLANAFGGLKAILAMRFSRER